MQQSLHEARNDDKLWNTKVLPLQRKLQSRLKGVVPQEAPPKALQSRTLHVHTDHLGTPRELTNAEGHIVWAASYKAWGATASIDHPAVLQTVRMGNTLTQHWVEQDQDSRPEQHLRFQGQYFDVETGLHYNRFRYYDPDVGRFVSQDPIGLVGGLNLYQYAPNPIDWIDPLGQMGYRKADIDKATDSVKIGAPISDKQAIQRAQRGENVHADSRSEAISLAKRCACGLLMKHPAHPNKQTGSTDGRLPHIHPNNHEGTVGDSHIFYPKR